MVVRSHLSFFISLIVLAVVMVPWLYYLWAVQAVNHDIFWLSHAAEMVLQGKRIGVDIYETNPPLSILLYIPIAVLMRLGVPVEHAVALYGLLLLALSFRASMAVMAADGRYDRATRLTLGLALLLVGTVLSTPHFGQRDQIIFFSLVPMLLVQMAVTGERSLPRWLEYTILFIGTLAIMLKPHYGLLPALMILHRMVMRRSFTIHADLSILTTVSIVYVTAVRIFFPDYVEQVLPDVMRFYVLEGRSVAWDVVTVCAVAGAGVLVAALWLRNGLSIVLTMAMLASLIVFVVMSRNYMYQLLPALSFFMMAGAMVLFSVLRKGLEDGSAMAGAITIIALCCVLGPHSYYPARQDIVSMPLTQAIAKECESNCRFMLWSQSLRVTQLSAHYAGAESASRFPNLWFMDGVAHDERSQRKYAAMMGEDLRHYAPQKVFACHEDGDKVQFFSIDPGFRAEWKHYRKAGKIMLDIAAYHVGMSQDGRPARECAVYKRL